MKNDFTCNPVFEVLVKVRVDCSNLPGEDYDYIYARFFNANEKRSKHNVRPTIDINYENSPFSWVGKTRIKIDKQDAFNDDDLNKLRVYKEKDWSDTDRLLKAIPDIIHYGIVDAKTGETWLKSADFDFITYTDEVVKEKIDERELFLKYFKSNGKLKSVFGIRLIKEKFLVNQACFDTERQFVSFFNDKKTVFGAAGKTDNFILFALFDKQTDKPLKEVDPENEVSRIFDRLCDKSLYLKTKVFTEAHDIEATAVFTSPGCYELNQIGFYNSRNEAILNINELEEVKLVIQPCEVDLLG